MSLSEVQVLYVISNRGYVRTKVTTRQYVVMVYLDLLSSNCEVMETRLIF